MGDLPEVVRNIRLGWLEGDRSLATSILFC